MFVNKSGTRTKAHYVEYMYPHFDYKISDKRCNAIIQIMTYRLFRCYISTANATLGV